MERITNAKISLRTLLVHTELTFCHSSEDGKGSKLEKNGTKFRFAVNFSFLLSVGIGIYLSPKTRKSTSSTLWRRLK